MLAVAGGGVFAIAVLGAVWLWRRRKEGKLRSVLKAIAISSQTDVTLPDTNRGKIHLEHLIFTAKGLLVLDVKNISGVVFGSDATEEWTTIDNAQRFSFRNPQPALLDRVAALKLVARDIPVEGYVVFPATADFSKGRPSHVIQPDELAERFSKPARADLERITDAFSPQWERVVATCEPSFKLAASA
ncbi:MAG: NERD domain-containing protein [Gammaproteobacteria bacterium]|nr:NERD domain-containing protein [Gammaproteobacteria bacterium]